MRGGHLRLHHLALPGSAPRPVSWSRPRVSCPPLPPPIGPPPSALPYPACFPAPNQPQPAERSSLPPHSFPWEGAFPGALLLQDAPAPPGLSETPPGQLAGSLGWAGRRLPKATQLVSAPAALGGVGATPSVLQGCSGDHGIAPALRAWTGPHRTPGSSGEMQGLGFDRGFSEAKGCLPQALPSPHIPQGPPGVPGILEPGRPLRAFQAGLCHSRSLSGWGIPRGWVPRAVQGFGNRPCV